jgi:hypothetical protein
MRNRARAVATRRNGLAERRLICGGEPREERWIGGATIRRREIRVERFCAAAIRRLYLLDGRRRRELKEAPRLRKVH